MPRVTSNSIKLFPQARHFIRIDKYWLV